MSFIVSKIIPSNIFSSNLVLGTNAGCVATLSGITSSIIVLGGIIGFSDTDTVITYAKELTGTLSISSSTDDIVGVGTLFTSELVVGDVLLLFDGTNIEYLTILTITDDTNIVTTTNATNSFSGVGTYKSSALMKVLADDKLNENLTIQNIASNSGKGLAVAIVTSTSECALTITGFRR